MSNLIWRPVWANFLHFWLRGSMDSMDIIGVFGLEFYTHLLPLDRFAV